MLAGGASSAIFPVSATSDSDLEPDSSVQITTEKNSDEDISLDGNLDGWDIKIDNSRKPDTKSDTKSDNGISVNGSEDGVTIKNNTESKKDDVKLEDAGDNDKPNADAANKTGDATKPVDADADTKDIAITKPADVLSASITRTDKNNSLDVDDAAALHVEAANKSENPAIFKMYFCDVREIKKGADPRTYLNKPALSCKVQGLSKECTLNVDVTGPNGKKTKSAMEFLKEIEKEADKDNESGSERIVSRYAKLLVPAGSSVDFDFGITSSKECAVTVIPVMVQETAVYGDAQSAEWEEKVTFFDRIVNFFTGKQPEKDDKDDKDDEDIQISDVQGVSADVSEGLNEDDFASKRLMVLSDDPSVFEGKNNVIGQYGSLYLMQFDSVEAAMQAYDYYKDIVTAVEPDAPVTVASNVDTDKDAEPTEGIDVKKADGETGETEQPSESDANIIEAVPEDNPINALNAMDASEDVKKAHGVIALIDTGVGEHSNVIDRVSVIDEALSGNGHGDAMADTIVSQDAEAKILSIRAMDDNGYGTVSALVAAMEYAIEQKVDIINLSLYARTTLATSVLKSEIEKATDAGIIVVGAAGNDGADVKDYMPGSVESAYIIGAAGKGGYRLVLSNYGETVDYNVAANTTSEASALFAGFVSAYGLDAVKGVLNKGLIYATDYKKDFFDFVEGDFKDGKAVTVKADGNVKVTVADLDAGKYHVYHVTGDAAEILVPKTNSVHIDVCTEDEIYSLESVAVLDADGNKIAEPEIKNHFYETVHSNVRNGFFDASGKELTRLDVVTANHNFPVSVYDEPSGLRYFESELCDDGDCLNDHVRRLTPDGMSHTIFCSDENCTGIHEVHDHGNIESGYDNMEDLLEVACGSYTNSHGQTYHRLCINCVYDNLAANTFGTISDSPGSDYYDMTPVTVTDNHWNLGEGVISGSVRANGEHVGHSAFDIEVGGVSLTGVGRCAVHGAAGSDFSGPIQFWSFGSYTDASDGKTYNLYGFWADHDGCQSVYGAYRIETTPPAPTKGGLSVQKQSGNTNATNNNGNYSLNNAVYDIYTDSWGYVTSITTGSDGYACTADDALDAGWYWVKEKTASSGYGLDASEYHIEVKAGQSAADTKVTSSEPPIYGSITVEKYSKDSSITDGASATYYDLKGARYGVYRNEACTDLAATIDINQGPDNGHGDGMHAWGTATGLPLGQYWVKEISASKGYNVSQDVHFIYLMSDTTEHINQTAKDYEPPKCGKIEVTKKSKNPAMTDGNSCYSYAGAKYGVYTDSGCTNKYGEITIAANGKGALEKVPFGNYWVKELEDGKVDGEGKSFAKGYYVDTEKHPVTVKDISGDSTNTVKCESEEPPMNDPLGISITKLQNGPLNGQIPSLAGARFTIKYYDFTKDTGNVTLSDLSGKTPLRTWVIQTKKVGNRYLAMLLDSYKVSGDDFYKDGMGAPILPLGTYTVQETQPAPGYVLNGNGSFIEKATGQEVAKDNGIYVTQLKAAGDAINLSGGNEYEGRNSTDTNIGIKLKKKGPDGNPISGVTYEIKYKTARSLYRLNIYDKAGNVVNYRYTNTREKDSKGNYATVIAENTKDVYDVDGNKVTAKTTNSSGEAKFSKLYPDEYEITEIKTVNGMQLLAEPITLTLPMRMTKAEAEKWNLDITDKTKVQWSEDEGKYLILEGTFEVTNDWTFAIPPTGRTVNIWTFIPLGLGMAVFTGIAVFLFRRKKRAVKAR